MTGPRRLPTWPGALILLAGLVLCPWSAFAGSSAMAIGGIVAFLTGSFWVGLCGWRTLGHGLQFVGIVLAVGLKLFSAELHLSDDPTVGVVLRSTPSLVSRVVDKGPGIAPPHTFLMGPDENSYFGQEFYRPVVRWGWIAAPLVWLLGWLTWNPLARKLNLHVPTRRRRGQITGRKRGLKRIAFYALGYAFLFLGVLGIFLPILQGILFLIVGFIFLAQVSPRVRLGRQRFRVWARARYPKWYAKFEGWEAQAKAYIDRKFKKSKTKSRTGGAEPGP